MTPVRILVDSLADQGLTNSQMTNAREIIRRLDSARFHVSVFCGGVPDRAIEQRPNTRLVSLPQRRRTVRILREFLLGRHDILRATFPPAGGVSYSALTRDQADALQA